MEDTFDTDNLIKLKGKLNSIKYNSNGSLLFTCDNTGIVYIKEKDSESPSSFECDSQYIDSEDLSITHKLNSINKIDIQKSSNNRACILLAIDKQIEIWKIYPQPNSLKNSELGGKKENSLIGVHECTINSISMCQNFKNFLSSDDLNVYLWDFNRLDKVCHIVDHKRSVNPLSEVITSCKFHPNNSYEILWTSTNGSIRLGDLRAKFLMDSPTQVLKYTSSSMRYYDDVIVSLSYADFCKNAECIVARDYFSVKYWDLRNTSSPCVIANVIENTNKCMQDLYESHAICAEFEVKDSFNSDFCATGTYGSVAIVERLTGTVRHKLVDTQTEILHLDVSNDGQVAFAASECLGIFNYYK
jgi:WD40 repeat protein